MVHTPNQKILSRMNNKQQEDYLKSFAYQEKVAECIGRYVFTSTLFYEDCVQGADLKPIEKIENVAYRIRFTPKAYEYYNFFTIRSKRLNKKTNKLIETELQKLLKTNSNYAKWMFYGCVNPNTDILDKWMLINLESFVFHYRYNLKKLDYRIRDNKDGTSFMAFNIYSFPKIPRVLMISSWDKK